MIEIVERIEEVRASVSDAKAKGSRIGFVPTMGALHAGHEALIEKCRSEADFVVVSIFVNPTQFGPNEDFRRYPRTIDSDRQVCERAGARMIFVPNVEAMYAGSPGLLTYVEVPEVSTSLEGEYRPGHFRGVATVVLKLFNIVQPDFAYFGAKDFQQLLVIKKLVADLNVPVEIRTLPTVREDDGLAMSSRNRYLNSAERVAARMISQALRGARKLVAEGERDANRVRQFLVERIGLEKQVKLEYAEVADQNSLEPLQEIVPGTPAIGLVAALVGTTRLIDNETLMD